MRTQQLYLAASAMVVARVAAQDYAHTFPIPSDHGKTVCDGLTVPDYDACDEVLDKIDQDGIKIGKGLYEGPDFKSENCTLRFVNCDDGAAFELDREMAGSMYTQLKKNCEGYEAGGGFRQGDACVVAEHPKNPFLDNKGKNDDDSDDDKEEDDEEEEEEEGKEKDNSESPGTGFIGNLLDFWDKKKKDGQSVEKRTLGRHPLDRREWFSRRDDSCDDYVEYVTARNVKGSYKFVCDDILPDGASCTKSKTVTTQETWEVGASSSVGIKEVVELGASFSYAESKSESETISTELAVDCPDGHGWVIWYPLMEVSEGTCGSGTEGLNGCFVKPGDQGKCTLKRPIKKQDGVLSGFYDVKCR